MAAAVVVTAGMMDKSINDLCFHSMRDEAWDMLHIFWATVPQLVRMSIRRISSTENALVFEEEK